MYTQDQRTNTTLIFDQTGISVVVNLCRENVDAKAMKRWYWLSVVEFDSLKDWSGLVWQELEETVQYFILVLDSKFQW